MPKAKTRFVEYESSGGDYYDFPLDVVPAGSGFAVAYNIDGTPVAPPGPRYWMTPGEGLLVRGRYWEAPFPCAAVIVGGTDIVYSRDGVTWVYSRDGVTWQSAFVESEPPAPYVPAKLSKEQQKVALGYYGVNQELRTRAGLDDSDNPLLRAAKDKLAELEAKKRVPGKAPLQLILDDPDGLVVLDDPTAGFGWADEIAHEIAEAEKAWDEAYRDAHGEHLQRHPELMVAACEEMLVTKDFGASLQYLGERYLPGFRNQDAWMYGLMQFFALECIVPVDAEKVRNELKMQSLISLLRLAKTVNWGQPVDSKDWTG